MRAIAVSTTVDRPPEEVFDHLAVLGRHEAFTDHMLVDWSVSGPEAGVGAKARARSTAPGAGWVDFEIVEAQRPHRLVERAVAEGGESTGTYRLEPAGEGRTNVTFEFAFVRMRRRDRLLAPVIAKALERGNRKAMDRLAEVLRPGT